VELRILGPIEVLADGRPVQLGGARQRALLAYLLLHANEVVPAERLLDRLWDDPPGLPALHSQVSRLRRRLGDRIVTSGQGYAIRVEPGELDLDAFRSLLAEAGAVNDPRERSGCSAKPLRSGAESRWPASTSRSPPERRRRSRSFGSPRLRTGSRPTSRRGSTPSSSPSSRPSSRGIRCASACAAS
jgi:hypothetical protein